VTALVDSSILIDHLRGEARARTLLAGGMAAGGRLFGSVLTRVEVLGGMRTGEEAATHQLLGLLEWIEVDQAIADRAGELGRRFLRSHPGVDPVDLVIAATAERVGAELWTRNLKHFPMIAELRDPYA
jgi:predicted nucleic acid-binding protein